jgi:tetratricopeptide (TPR) repeat protein
MSLGTGASRLRSKLGESRASLESHNVPLPQVTTSSLEALQALDRAQKAFYDGDLKLAFNLGQRAVTLDPNFATAWAFIGAFQARWLPDDSSAIESTRKTFELREHVSYIEKLLISINYYRDGLRDFDKALEVIQQYKKDYPNGQPNPLFYLGDIYAMMGRSDEGVAPILEYVKLEPNASCLRAFDICLAANRLDEAETVIKIAKAHRVNAPVFGYGSYLIAFRRQDEAGMAANEAVARKYFRPGIFDVVNDLYGGRLSSLRDALRRKSMSLSSTIWGSAILALAGYPAEAKRLAADAIKVAKERNLLGGAAITLAVAGDTEGARKLASDLNQRYPESTAIRCAYVPSVRAILAMKEGKPQEAIQSLAIAGPYEMMNNMTAVYLRGEAFLAAGQGTQAAAEFQKMLERPAPEYFDIFRNLLPHLGLARVCALQGDAAKARAEYEQFLAMWKDADPDIPILKQAKAEYADLLKKKNLI